MCSKCAVVSRRYSRTAGAKVWYQRLRLRVDCLKMTIKATTKPRIGCVQNYSTLFPRKELQKVTLCCPHSSLSCRAPRCVLTDA